MGADLWSSSSAPAGSLCWMTAIPPRQVWPEHADQGVALPEARAASSACWRMLAATAPASPCQRFLKTDPYGAAAQKSGPRCGAAGKGGVVPVITLLDDITSLCLAKPVSYLTLPSNFILQISFMQKFYIQNLQTKKFHIFWTKHGYTAYNKRAESFQFFVLCVLILDG